ncbi:MAG TPA: 3,4-dihydroxy-2-butanone-4-phosphate synthase [Dehalococcoidales bacterium]|nr:3,4-dihydroxy-2-butanone-4-phosphate synthase [Dehalococcoidales bacterium]
MFNRVRQAIKAFQERRFVIIFSETENEADLAIPAQEITVEAILFAARVASGLLCLALSKDRLKELEIDALPSRYRATDTPFYSPVDAKEVEKSGISPRDRAVTIRKVIDPNTRPEDLARPGHVAILGAHPDGLIGRNGHTEAVVELSRLAGLYPGGVLCELVSDNGEMMNAKELKTLARKFDIPIVTVGTLAKFARSVLTKKT